MTAIVILISSFIVAILGFVHSHAAESGATSLFGLTRLGAALILVASIGFAFGVVQQIQARRSEADRTRMLQEVHAKITGEAEQASPETAQALREIGDRIRMIATVSRESDFAMSDFARSNFERGRFADANFASAEFSGANFRGSVFRGASFTGARFPGADFRGADLSTALVDEGTVLPTR